MMDTASTLRATIRALMQTTGESQRTLAASIGMAQPQVCRRMRADGRGSAWTLDDLDKLSAHWGIPVPDLIAGPDAALRSLAPERRATTIGGQQTMLAAA
ncbi:MULTISPECIES: hypothetical protein [Streptomyces]|uniref:hypothetical protein n=1 Tax=Streptomyces TaxID=1883 RepID=UPI000282E85A|nr:MULTISPECIES: hypothetical protein [unclassified Streptomyces]PKA38326.1 acyltransferase [Streptomyces sp. SM8]WSD44283.1 acyltransferase [Streptomyces albidoflavus]